MSSVTVLALLANVVGLHIPKMTKLDGICGPGVLASPILIPLAGMGRHAMLKHDVPYHLAQKAHVPHVMHIPGMPKEVYRMLHADALA